jgi:hypothetical protein
MDMAGAASCRKSGCLGRLGIPDNPPRQVEVKRLFGVIEGQQDLVL